MIDGGVSAQINWNWARAHLCGRAVTSLVDEMEKREKPFTDLGKRLVAVEIKAATATPAPATFHVFWEETSTEYTVQRTKKYTGTFTVGRFQPQNQAVLMQNRLGLCIHALSISEQPS
jgi:type IV secretory pathway TrbF-like protein